MRRGRRQYEPNYGAVSVYVEGTAPAGGGVRRRRRRATEREEAGNRRIELSVNDSFSFSDQNRKLRGTCFFSDGGKVEPIGIQCHRKHVGRVS